MSRFKTLKAAHFLVRGLVFARSKKVKFLRIRQLRFQPIASVARPRETVLRKPWTEANCPLLLPACCRIAAGP
jgi:hypothetical protein